MCARTTSPAMRPSASACRGRRWPPASTGICPAAFADAANRRLVDILQPDVLWAGGITAAVKICHIAEAAGLSVITHAGMNYPYGQHLAFAMPAIQWGERSEGVSSPGVPLAEMTLLPGTPAIQDGYVRPSDAPGFGLEITKEWLEAALGLRPVSRTLPPLCFVDGQTQRVGDVLARSAGKRPGAVVRLRMHDVQQDDVHVDAARVLHHAPDGGPHAFPLRGGAPQHEIERCIADRTRQVGDPGLNRDAKGAVAEREQRVAGTQPSFRKKHNRRTQVLSERFDHLVARGHPRAGAIPVTKTVPIFAADPSNHGAVSHVVRRKEAHRRAMVKREHVQRRRVVGKDQSAVRAQAFRVGTAYADAKHEAEETDDHVETDQDCPAECRDNCRGRCW